MRMSFSFIFFASFLIASFNTYFPTALNIIFLIEVQSRSSHSEGDNATALSIANTPIKIYSQLFSIASNYLIILYMLVICLTVFGAGIVGVFFYPFPYIVNGNCYCNHYKGFYHPSSISPHNAVFPFIISTTSILKFPSVKKSTTAKA